MRILLISDTHGKIERALEIYQKLRTEAPIDMIVHCGDFYEDAREIGARLGVRILSVKGNCDGCFDEAEGSAILETEAGDIFVTHGHMQDVNFNMQKLFYTALDNGCVGAFFGHTHRSVNVETGGVTIVNPGSLTKPHDGSTGSFALVVTSEDGIWCKVYDYEKFVGKGANGGNSTNGDNANGISACDSPGGGQTGGGQAGGSAGGGAGGSADGATDDGANSNAVSAKKKPKVRGGHLRDLLNYSDRF